MTQYRTPKVHFFAASGEAYNASQTSDQIADGDVLIVASEGVAAVLNEAWPVALYSRSHLTSTQFGPVREATADESGEFHYLLTSLESWLADNPQYATSALVARCMLGYPNLHTVPLFQYEA